jgi:hypothetical protein
MHSLPERAETLAARVRKLVELRRSERAAAQASRW